MNTPHPTSPGIYPTTFSTQSIPPAAAPYLDDPAARALLQFFETKGLPTLKQEDRREHWYTDWLAFQSQHRLYAQLLSPAEFSTTASHFDLLRYARFLEVFAFCSPAHGYSLQVTFLGLFSILMGSNEPLKREAIDRLQKGDLLAFGVSERTHGSDLLANEFQVTRDPTGQLIANGSKYYIGNANAAAIIATLAHERPANSATPIERAPFILIALRPQLANSWTESKIPTLGVRAAHVGDFTVKNYPLPESDIIAQGRKAWDAVFGTVTLGKFFLGFGSIGICEHALHEAAAHLQNRILYAKPALEMPHLRNMMTEAYLRLLAMKLYAYRTLDYVHAASPTDRRYLFFCALQKAKVSTQGVKIMALLSECIGAKSFEADTFCEMALRDIALIPGLEGSMHINLALATQFMPRYFHPTANAPVPPPSLLAGDVPSQENPYLTSAKTGATHAIQFPSFLDAFRPFTNIPNAITFARQSAAFRHFTRHLDSLNLEKSNTQLSIPLGHCLATIAYAQLIAENAAHLQIPNDLVSLIFSLLITDLSTSALQLAATPIFPPATRTLLKRIIKTPHTTPAQWTTAATLLTTLAQTKN